MTISNPEPSLDRNEDSSIQNILERCGLKYYPELKLLICNYAECKCQMGPNFYAHTQRYHNVTVSSEDQRRINDELDFVNPLISYDHLNTPLAFLPILHGYRCNICHACYREREYMKTHCRRCHDDDSVFAECCVQSLTKGNGKKYFGVISSSGSLPSHQQFNEEDNEFMDAFIAPYFDV